MLKLIKYDLSVGAKKYFLMTFVMLTVSASLLLTTVIKNDFYFSTACFLTVMGVAAFLVMYPVISVSHFYSQMSGSQSYLTYTLPVSEGKILLSKFICIVIWGFYVMGITVLFAFTILDKIILARLSTSLNQVFAGVFIGTNMTPAALTANITVCLIFTLVMNLATYGFCMTLINVPRLKYKNMGIPVAAGAAFLISQIIGVIQLLIWLIAMRLSENINFQALIDNNFYNFDGVLVSLTISTVSISIVTSILFFFMGKWVIKRHRSI